MWWWGVEDWGCATLLRLLQSFVKTWIVLWNNILRWKLSAKWSLRFLTSDQNRDRVSCFRGIFRVFVIIWSPWTKHRYIATRLNPNNSPRNELPTESILKRKTSVVPSARNVMVTNGYKNSRWTLFIVIVPLENRVGTHKIFLYLDYPWSIIWETDFIQRKIYSGKDCLFCGNAPILLFGRD